MRLTASTEVVAVMGSIEASSDSGEFEGRRMNKEQKNPDQNWLLKKRKKENYNIGQNLSARLLKFFIPI